jgi:hypothetical protein
MKSELLAVGQPSSITTCALPDRLVRVSPWMTPRKRPRTIKDPDAATGTEEEKSGPEPTGTRMLPIVPQGEIGIPSRHHVMVAP